MKGILEKLKSAPKETGLPRPQQVQLNETDMGRDSLIDRFTAELAGQTGIVLRASGVGDARDRLSGIAASENIKSILVSDDEAVRLLGLKEWAGSAGIEVIDACSLRTRDDLKDKAFSADAGMTGADFAVAESGTIGIASGKCSPRLASIAPPVHIAVIPIDRLFPTYEAAMENYIRHEAEMPSQLIMITGPSSTADIQATPFKGMHGPGKLIVIFTD